MDISTVVTEPLAAPRQEATQPVNNEELAPALYKTLLYADIFNYPLTADEAHRFLIGAKASRETVREAAEQEASRGSLANAGGQYTLPCQEHLAALRAQRKRHAEALWAWARRCATLLGGLPFVRMVAVTGSLAMNNVKRGDDIDLFIVAEAGRLWLARGLVVLVARAARLWRIELCPNYLVATSRLRIPQQDLYGAHELAQMAPLYGYSWYQRVWDTNSWLGYFLPNATPKKGADVEVPLFLRVVKSLGELLLRGPLGATLERWERRRKIPKLQRRARQEGGNVFFSSDECRGHFGGHERRVLETYFQRLAQYQEDG